MKAWLLLMSALLLTTVCAQRPTTSGTLADLAKEPPPAPPAEAAADRGRAIAGYRDFLGRTDDPILKAEAMRRLADLSLEAEEEKQANLPEAVAAAEPVAQEVPTSAQPLPSDETGQIIRLYEERLKAYPYHPQNDQVLYQLSRAYDNAGRQEDELRVLDRLIGQYPYTPLIAEAQFRRGELLFLRKRYEEADVAYRAVLGRGPESGFYEQALYKRAWSLFKQSEYLEGIDYFLALIDRKSVQGRLELDQLSRTERETIEDTLRAISLSFSYLAGPETVAEYFLARGGRKDEDVLYRALGEEYLKKDRFSDAAATFQAFVAAYPDSPYGPPLQLRAIEAFRAGGFPSQVLEAQKAYVRLYDLRSPFWRNRKPDAHPAIVAQLRISLFDLARHYHAQAQKSKEAADYASASDWYQRYLTNFPTEGNAQEVRFLYAELLYEHHDFAAAAEQYQQVAYKYERNERAAEAAYATVLSLEQAGKEAEADARLPWVRQTLVAASRLAKDFPQHPQALPALTHGAQQAFDLGDSAAAAAAAEQLLEMPGLSPQTRLTALRIQGHTAFDQGDFLVAETAYRRALNVAELSGEERKQIGDRLAASIYKQGEQHRQGGDLAGAARTFLRAAGAVPDSAMAATAQFDAAALLIELQQWPEAIEALQTFRRQFPEHEQQPEVTRRLAAAYLAADQSGAAAEEYLQVAAAASTPELQRVALWQAAESYRGADQREQAYATFRRYAREFPDPVVQRMEAQQQLLELSLEMGHHKSARSWRLAMIETDAGAGAARTDRTRFLAAHATLALAEQPLQAYEQVRLNEPLETNLRKKKAGFEKAQAAYERAAAYKVADVVTQANYAIASLYADFANALLTSERPRGLKADALAEYEALLEEEALPFENKAIELHELNAGRTSKGIYDDWIRKSFDALAELVPVRYAKIERGDTLVETLY
jgi:TolA-binding protein